MSIVNREHFEADLMKLGTKYNIKGFIMTVLTVDPITNGAHVGSVIGDASNRVTDEQRKGITDRMSDVYIGWLKEIGLVNY